MRTRRITVTVPAELVEAADTRAGELDRSRSWVVSEALRRHVGPGEPRPRRFGPPRRAGLGPYREAQLADDLRLTPEERVREAERTAQVDRILRGRVPGHRVISFDRYEDYLDWKRHEDRGG